MKEIYITSATLLENAKAVTHCTTVDDGILFTIIEGVLRRKKMADPALTEIGLNIAVWSVHPLVKSS